MKVIKFHSLDRHQIEFHDCDRTMLIIMPHKTLQMMLLLVISVLCACSKQMRFQEETPIPSTMGFYQLYELNRKQGVPNFITEDFWLLGYSLLRMQRLQYMEKTQFMPLFKSVITDLHSTLGKTIKDDIDQANFDFICILASLIETGPLQLSETANQELDLITKASGPKLSPLWGYRIDYSQFIPRGRYTDHHETKAYFKAMAYAGAVLFAVQGSPSTGISESMAERMTGQALRLTELLVVNEQYKKLLDSLYWHMGAIDDLSVKDYQKISKSKSAPTKAIQRDILNYALYNGKQSKIINMEVDASALHKITEASVIGWRLLPSHFTIGNAIFQSLVYNRTGNYLAGKVSKSLPFGYTLINGQGVKGFPSVKELMALAGSRAAESWLLDHGENQFQGYDQAYRDAKSFMYHGLGLNYKHWCLIRHWFEHETETNPGQKLNTAMGFWTWQRYIELLYTKQSYTLSNKSTHWVQPRPGATMSPAIGLYRDLIAIVKLHQAYDPSEEWRHFEKLLQQAVRISEVLLNEETLNQNQVLFLNALDIELGQLTGDDYPVIVDVHTNSASAQVVEEGVGYAKITQRGAARGARFSHYEFKSAIENRLTREDWAKRLLLENAAL